MKNKQNKRWRVFADTRIQGLLCLRLALYWFVCQSSIVFTILAMSSFFEGTQDGSSAVSLHFIVPALTVSTLMFPVFLFDILVFSNRFAGPMVNFRRKMKQLVENETCEKIAFRKGDYYMDLAEHFNQVQELIKPQSPTPAEDLATQDSARSTFPPVETPVQGGIQSHV